MAGFEVAVAFPLVERFSGLRLRLKNDANTGSAEASRATIRTAIGRPIRRPRPIGAIPDSRGLREPSGRLANGAPRVR